jgi:hypothetical protein
MKFSRTTFLWKPSWPTRRILAMCKATVELLNAELEIPSKNSPKN